MYVCASFTNIFSFFFIFSFFHFFIFSFFHFFIFSFFHFFIFSFFHILKKRKVLVNKPNSKHSFIQSMFQCSNVPMLPDFH